MAQQSKSLRSRLTTLVMVAIFGAVSIATASSVWREIAQYGEGKNEQLKASANVFASAIAAHVQNGDAQAAVDSLQAVSFISSIEHVRIVLIDNSLFAEIGDAPKIETKQPFSDILPEQSALRMLFSGSVATKAPIQYEGETIATIILHANADELSNKIGFLIYDALVAAIFAGGIGVLIALRMQRSITDPILYLARVMSHVRESGDFNVRAKTDGVDESAQLVDTFNTMLDQIQERDTKLKTQQRNLTKIVETRTAQLRTAKEAAEAANMAKSDFLATMSHEIRTPMNGMLAMADLLSNANLPPQHKRYAKVIAKSGQGLLAIINDVLDFSKIEAGRMELENIRIRTEDLVDDVVSLFWEHASSKGIDLVAYVAPGTPEIIEGDPVRISQVLSNLVNNGLKFTDEGHVTVAVRPRPIKTNASEHDPVVEFSVTDTGVGIAEEQQRKIFDAFSQADQTTTRKFGGTGLGLAICQRLVKAMDGEFSLHSKPGQGAKFSFCIPTKSQQVATATRRASVERRAVIAIHGEATAKTLALYLREAGIIPQIIPDDESFGPHIACADMIFASTDFFKAYQQSIDAGNGQWIPARICVGALGDTGPEALVMNGVIEDLLVAPLRRKDVMAQIERVLDDNLRGPSALDGDNTHNLEQPLAAFKRQRVLAADDSIVNREVVREILEKLNLSVTLASNGREAVQLFENESFDLVLMDCSMPEMDGFEATQAIRILESKTGKPRLPILALTAHVTGQEKRWREAGMDECLSKPFTISSLGKALQRHLEIGEQTIAPFGTDIEKTSLPAGKDEPGALFDPSILGALADMQTAEGNLAARALLLFADHSRNALRSLAEAMKTNDAQEIASAAHALKSTSVNVGAIALADACGALELRASEGAPMKELHILCKTTATAFRETHGMLPEKIAFYQKPAA